MLRACCGWQRSCDTAARRDLEGKADTLDSPLLSTAHWHLHNGALRVACTACLQQASVRHWQAMPQCPRLLGMLEIRGSALSHNLSNRRHSCGFRMGAKIKLACVSRSYTQCAVSTLSMI